MTGLTLTSLTGSLTTNPRFQAWLAAKMQRAVVAGANAVAESHTKILAGWARKPGFGQKDLSDMSRLLALREVRVTGPHAWKWILTNYGGSTIKSGPITKYMKFPYSGTPGSSYFAATDTFAPGRKITKAPTVTFLVKERNIRPRNMISIVSRQYRPTILKAMERAF